MEGKLHDQGKLNQGLEEWLYPRGSQTNRGLFSEEEKQKSTQIDGSFLEVPTISNQALYGSIYTMMVVKCSDAAEGPIVKLDGPLCGRLYK